MYEHRSNPKLRAWLIGMLAVLVASFGELSAEDAVDADILLIGGTLHLGDGQPATQGAVAIRGDTIVAVGQFTPGTIGRVVDCAGLIVSPGFIDLHNHSDQQVLDRETRAVMNYLTQGCTTIVTGNCGSGPVAVGEYYDTIDQLGAGVNVAHLLPQGDLREAVMGSQRRAATPEELARMKTLADDAMRAGAWGMTTGLIYVPSSYATTDELVEIAQVVAKHQGLYASHIRGEGTMLLDSVHEALDIGERAGLPIHISHFKSSGTDSWGLVRVAAAEIAAARRSGREITADQYPYTASSTSLSATFIPPWARAGGNEQMLLRFDDAVDGPRIREAITDKLRLTDDGQRIQIAEYVPQPTWAGQRLPSIAQQQGIEPLELVLQILRGGGASIVNHSINEEDVRFVMALPWVATASDGSSRIPSATVPHPRSYGTFPRKIGHYALGEHAVTLEHAIRSCSGLPADILRLHDRGYLRVGHRADVIVWDRAEIIDTATYEAPHSYARGMRYVFVNGVTALHAGQATGALAGRALRHTSPIAGDAPSDF